MKNLLLLTALFWLFLFTLQAQAHPGRTAGDGCHYCRTNCSKWGVEWDERHCHGSYSKPSYSKPSTNANYEDILKKLREQKYVIPDCPLNSTYSKVNKICVCSLGFGSSFNKQYCVKIPENAHAVESTTDIWLCNENYKEIGNICIEDCPANAEISKILKKCVCEDGYEMSFSNKACIKIPAILMDITEATNTFKQTEQFVPQREIDELFEAEEETKEGKIGFIESFFNLFR
ncbi:hypothetical protein HON22_04390 [Candidatus Peregrinibacteria bacterium]|jgi:hypothetical protein|nr:hypothetical protein [Candidatus Peregrinibacteria bacterium]